MNISRSVLFHMKTRVCLKDFVNDFSANCFLFLTRPSLLKVDLLKNFGISKVFNTVLTSN